MMRDIFFHGVIGRRFGRHFRLDVASPAEAVRALTMRCPGLRDMLRKGYWRVIVGPPRLRYAVPAECLLMNAGSQPIHLVPATGAAGGGGGGKSVGVIIVGVVLIAAAIVFAPAAGAGLAGFAASMATTSAVGISYASIALIGASLVFSGIAGLLASPPSVEKQQATDRAAPEDRPSFLFNGVVNNSQQGGPVPLLFGTHLVGSIVISAGLAVEDIPA